MFDIKRIITFFLSIFMVVSLTACKGKDDGIYVESGELVVLSDDSTINLGIYGIDTLNPFETKSENVKNIVNIIYEPLFAEDETKTPIPVLAKSLSVAGEGTQITVTLKDGVKWQDGTVFTAEDVVHTISKMCSSNGFYRKLGDKIRSFTATGKNQVVINFENPEPNPELLLSFPIISKSAQYTGDMNFIPVGTGSYKFTSKTGTEIMLEPNSIWHGGDVSQKNISVKILKDKDAVREAFNVSKIDAITSGELGLDGATPKMNSRTETIVSDNMVFVGFNVASPVLQPANIRKALGDVIDKKKILENDVYGHGKVADLAINPSSWAYQSKSETEEDYAENLITSEGYELSEGFYFKDGMPLTIRILVNSDNEKRTALAGSIAEMLKTEGFFVEIDKVSYNEYVAKISNGSFDLFVGEVEVEPNLNPASMLDSVNNYFNYDINKISEATRKLAASTDREAYKEGITDFMRKFYADPPYIPLYFKSDSVIYGTYVSGTEKPSLGDPYKDIEKWYFYDKDGKRENGEETDE